MESTSTSAISVWHDTDEIYTRLYALVKQPIRPLQREYMSEALRYFETSCALKSAHGRGQTIHTRRGAAQPGFQLPLPDRHRAGRGGLPVGCGWQSLYRLPAGRRADHAGQQLRSPARNYRQPAAILRAGDGVISRVRAQAGETRQPLHAFGGDVPHARLREPRA